MDKLQCAASLLAAWLAACHLHDPVHAPGIDVDSSSHVTITDCDIATADDALCIKTTSSSSSSSRVLQRARGGRSADAVGKESSTGISGEGSRGGSGGNDGAGCGVTSHVSATNCTLRSKSAAIKLGSESRADMRHLLFSDIRVGAGGPGSCCVAGTAMRLCVLRPEARREPNGRAAHCTQWYRLGGKARILPRCPHSSDHGTNVAAFCAVRRQAAPHVLPYL